MGKRIYNGENRRLYQFTVGGNYYTRSSGGDLCLETSDLATALANLAYQDSLVKRFGAKAFKHTLGTLFPKFLKQKSKEVRASTYANYELLWGSFTKHKLDRVKVGDMGQRVWSRYCEKAKGTNDFQNHKNLMHQFLKWCELGGYIKAIPTLKNPKHKRRRRKVIPQAHLAMIFQRAQGSLLLFCSMALFMGMRRKEIMTLSWDRVDLVHRSLRLRDEDVKTDEAREIPITGAVHALLVERLKEQLDAGVKTMWVFPNREGSRRHADVQGLMTAWRTCLLHCGLARAVKNIGKKSKRHIVVDYTWHDFRATYETYSLKSTAFTKEQKEKMVGADIDVQKRIYATMTADDLRGLEEVVAVQGPEIAKLLANRPGRLQRPGGKRVENRNLILSKNRASDDER